MSTADPTTTSSTLQRASNQALLLSQPTLVVVPTSAAGSPGSAAPRLNIEDIATLAPSLLQWRLRMTVDLAKGRTRFNMSHSRSTSAAAVEATSSSARSRHFHCGSHGIHCHQAASAPGATAAMLAEDVRNRGNSWTPRDHRNRKSATVTTSRGSVPVSLLSSIFDFVLGTSPSWSLKLWTLRGRTPYRGFYDHYKKLKFHHPPLIYIV